MTKLRIIVMMVLILLTIIFVRKIQKRKLDLKYTLSWFFLILLFIVLDFFPGIIKWISNLIGIKVPSNLLFFVGICVCLIVIYTQTVAISKLTDEIRILSQKMGILDKKVEELSKEENN